jgi:hypothetical protein
MREAGYNVSTDDSTISLGFGDGSMVFPLLIMKLNRELQQA